MFGVHENKLEVINEPVHDTTYIKTCAISEDSGQLAHPRIPIRLFAERMCLLLPPGYPKREKREPLSYLMDVQSDRSRCWLHRSYCRFCRALAQLLYPLLTGWKIDQLYLFPFIEVMLPYCFWVGDNFQTASARRNLQFDLCDGKDSNKPLHPPSMARVLVYPSLDSPESVEGTCNQRRLWSDCADAQADLNLSWLHVLLKVLSCDDS